jgi:putative ABC transport system permease protein
VSPIRTGLVQIEGSTTSVSAVQGSTIEQLFDVGFETGSAEELDDGGIAVYTGVAEDKGWEIGDVIPVAFADTGTVDLTLVGTYERKEIAGNYVISLETHRENFTTQTDFAVYVNFADGADAGAVRSSIESLVDSEYPTVEVQDQAEFKEAQASQIQTMLNLIYGLLGLAVVIALIGIANTLALSIFERTRELGLLRAVGMTRSQLRSSVRWESVIIALLGTALGLVISVFFGWAVVQALESEGFRTFVVPGGQLLVIVVAAAVAGVIAAIGPARRAAKLNVLRAITVE